MRKFSIVLAMAGAMSAPVAAQTEPQQQASPQGTRIQPAKPQMIKKRICEQAEEDSYSRLGGRKICRTVEVPVQQGESASGRQAPATNSTPGK